MAAKLILSLEGAVLQEYVLDKGRITIGRKPHNDVVIDNLAVSGEHAAVVTILNDSFLEDLDSTNGVVVNGVSIKKYFLQTNDIIEIGKYKLKYLNEQHGPQPAAAEEDFERTMVLRSPGNKIPATGASPGAAEQTGINKARSPQANPPAAMQHEATGKYTGALHQPQPAPAPTKPAAQSPAAAPLAALQLLSGQNAGRELDLVKSLTTLGKPGVQVAVLTRRPHAYFITHVEGTTYPLVNGKTLNDQPHQLNNHDIIDLAGIKMEFYLKD